MIPSYSKAVAVTPADGTDLPGGDCNGLWIGVAGTLTFIPVDHALAAGGASVSTTVPAGLFPIKVKRVKATGTAATGIVALY